MTLDEGIKTYEEASEKMENEAAYWSLDCDSRSKEIYKGMMDEAIEHRQIAEWLKELKAVQDIIKQHDSDSIPEDYWYIDKIRMEVLE